MSEEYVFVDVESAALREHSQIIQLAAIAVDSELRELEAFERKIRFDVERADKQSLRLNSFEPLVWKRLASRPEGRRGGVRPILTPSMRRSTCTATKAHRSYRVARLVAHNGSFDGLRLQTFYDDLGLFLPAARSVYCTLQRAYWLFAEDTRLTPPANYKLGTLCEYFGVSLPDSATHNARHDVRACLELYRAMKRHAQLRRQEAA